MLTIILPHLHTCSIPTNINACSASWTGTSTISWTLVTAYLVAQNLGHEALSVEAVYLNFDATCLVHFAGFQEDASAKT